MSNKNRALIFDLVFLSIICVISEVVSYYAVTRYSSGYYFSITLIISFIAIYRLGYIGVITSIVTAITFCFIYEDASMNTFIVYILGNSGIVIASMFINKVGRDSIRDNYVMNLLYILSGYLSIIAVRGVVSFILDSNINLISGLFLVLSNEFLSIIGVVMLFSLLAKRKFLLIDLNQLYDEAVDV